MTPVVSVAAVLAPAVRLVRPTTFAFALAVPDVRIVVLAIVLVVVLAVVMTHVVLAVHLVVAVHAGIPIRGSRTIGFPPRRGPGTTAVTAAATRRQQLALSRNHKQHQNSRCQSLFRE
jgi:hypothetical protein